MAFSYTPEQQKVIELRDRNILVSAAAGSGKTAVLVERIIRMITDEAHPVDIDRILVVTFTNAAAAEMRERISLAVSAQLELTPESTHLQKQAALLHNAQITTIDSFCLFLLRNNFNDIGLDPGFRVADENELRLLKQDVLTELLEQNYLEKRPEYIDCVEYFTGGGNDKLLEEYISKLYQFSMSNPWPEEWLLGCASDYDTEDDKLLHANWVKYLEQILKINIQECLSLMEEAIGLTERPDGPYMYGALLEKEKEMLEGLSGLHDFQDFYEAFGKISFDRLPSKKDDTVNPDYRDKAKQLRDKVKNTLKKLQESYLILSPEQVVKRMKKATPSVKELIRLVIEYKHALDEKKRQKNMIDFSDMEHFALEILLRHEENGDIKPSAAALEYRQYFHEIMIDEYQDSNLVQELLLKSISGEEDGHFNRFMVGDVKQSIYKFRLARPELFIDKYENYLQEDSSCQRIDLCKNFRSRPQVLGSVNRVFSRIMGKRLGSIDYDENAALYQGAEFPQCGDIQCTEKTYATEYLIAEKNKESNLSSKEQEAQVIAQRIKALYRDLKVTDKKTGLLRPVRYGDMVILLRTTSGWAEDFKKILEKESIPAYIAAHTGYFEASEIRVIMEFLQVIDNPLQDIPFYGTMKSFFGEFSEEEIAFLRAKDKQCSLYELLCMYKEFEQGTELQFKITKLLNRIGYYRQKITYTPIHKLLQDILTDTGYLDYVTARPDGQQRRANVEMLLTRAASFEGTSYYGLFHFLQYIRQLKKYEVDYGEADVLDEKADVVRIMSIHKSKGLEFPVCFVAGLAKKFNMQDTSGRLIADVDMGIGVDYIDSEMRIQSKTLKKNVVATKMKLEALGEEMRVLYVAMTRAKEKLILTALTDDAEKMMANLEYQDREKSDKENIPFGVLTSAGKLLDFLLPCLGRNDVTLVTSDLLEAEKDQESLTLLIEKQKLLQVNTQGEEYMQKHPETAALKAKLEQRFERCYAYDYLSELYVKTTVSELKMKAMPEEVEKAFTKNLFEEAEVVPYIPEFITKKEGMSGSDRGSAYHKVMELLNMKAVLSALSENPSDQSPAQKEIIHQLDLFEQEETLTKEWRDCISIPKIVRFFEGNLALRMVQAKEEGKLYREQPFVLGLPASRLGEQFPETEQVLIQGIIDVFWEEDGNIIVADYKTDVVKSADELVRRYQTQLDYYAEALERLTGKKVIEKIIYSFSLGEEIDVDREKK